MDPDFNPWDEFVRHAKTIGHHEEIVKSDIDPKVETGRRLAAARKAVLAEDANWADLVKKGISASKFPIIFPIDQAKFKSWINKSPDAALRALRAVWTRDYLSVSERIRAFYRLFDQQVLRTPGSRTTVVSVLLMGLDAERYPPFKTMAFKRAYERTGYDSPEQNADEAALYDHALGFLDRFMEQASKRGLTLRHRLDAQSMVWLCHFDKLWNLPIQQEDSPPAPPNSDMVPSDLLTLATELHLTAEFLRGIQSLLYDKGQVIFQGPPGTGKTYVAQELAEHLAGSKERVTLVQLHPSYAYEDFVQGYRPTLKDGQPGFELRDGPLLRAAKHAQGEPDADHFLVIDEINRGNLAKVFGELYFLLEYRDREMRLQYSDEPFSLPKNLYVIGTMNTADRSIALVDLALRRRFYFVEFHPDNEPIKGVLRRWIQAKAPDMDWVAGVVERANAKQQLKEDRHAAIGPSYFMKAGLDDEAVDRIWKHSVLPYIEERLFAEREGLDEFALDKLRGAGDGAETQQSDENEGGGAQ